jgi:hypothetical protein
MRSQEASAAAECEATRPPPDAQRQRTCPVATTRSNSSQAHACNNPFPQTNTSLTACPTPGPSTACGEAERPARLPNTRRSGVAARKHISEAQHLQATRRVQGRVGPAEARTPQVFGHLFTPKPRARSGTLHRSPRLNRPPAAAELPGVAAPGAQRRKRGPYPVSAPD